MNLRESSRPVYAGGGSGGGGGITTTNVPNDISPFPPTINLNESFKQFWTLGYKAGLAERNREAAIAFVLGTIVGTLLGGLFLWSIVSWTK